MEKGTEPAFPCMVHYNEEGRCGIQNQDGSFGEIGMSTRLYLAGMAMQGILAGDSTALTCTTKNDVLEPNRSYKYDYSKIVNNSLRLADELLKQEEETR